MDREIILIVIERAKEETIKREEVIMKNMIKLKPIQELRKEELVVDQTECNQTQETKRKLKAEDDHKYSRDKSREKYILRRFISTL